MSDLPQPSLLTRDAVTSEAIRALVRASDPGLRLMSDEEYRESVRATLAARPVGGVGGDVWLFAYGSLIWNPMIHFVEQRVGTIHGYHRRFCLWTHVGRGCAANPGLMLGLERGGVCRGLAFRISEAKAAAELELVWRREMLTSAYCPRWVKAMTEGGPIAAIAFVINRQHERYAGLLDEERVAGAIATAEGPLGTCATYLYNTVAHLEALGIRDERMMKLRDRVAALIEEMKA
ncbi:MAG TPA: gamma-glutamylcyclotransferase [Stellaceae bacterium]|nr:gamma-glutamylcyclotransferase [Stellaceae bacterium]